MANTLNFNIKTNTDFSDLAKLKKELNEIRSLARDVDFTGIMSPDEIDNMVRSANKLEQAMDQAFDYDLNTVNIEKFNRILRDSGTNIAEVQKGLALAGDVGQKAFLTATTELLKFNNITAKTNTLLDKMATTMGNTIKWGITSSLWNNITGSIQKSFYYIKDLDTALNDIRIVTEKSSEDMAHFAVQANNAAKALSTSTQDYTEGALLYYQQGLDDDTVKTLTDITAKTANVTGQSMEAVSEQLTAVWNGYRVANQAATEGLGVYQEYVDKMAAVGAMTASDLEEIATAMSKVSSAASSMGVGFDDLNAQIATIVSVTRQAPESVGTALKTIYARIGDLKLDGVDEFGVQLGEVSGQLEDLGIEILDRQGNVRDMSSVIQEVAGEWDKWTDAQKRAAAEAMAGKRQYNNLIALFDNWDMYTDALVTSQEAMGTLNKQSDIALESMRNKMETLSATAEDLYDNLFDEESVINLVEGLTDVTQGMANIAESVGGLDNILLMLGSTGAKIFSKQIASSIGDAYKNLTLFFDKTKQAEANYLEIQSMFENSTGLFGQEGERDEAQTQNWEKAKEFYSDIAQKQGLMNENELKAAQNIQQQIALYGELNLQHQDQVEALKKSNEQLQFFNDLTDQNTLDEQVKKLKEMAKAIALVSDTFEETNEGVEKARETIDALTINLQSSGLFDDKLFENSGFFNKLGDDVAGAGTNIKALKKVLADAVKELENVGATADDIAKLKNELDSLDSKIKSASDSLQKSLKPKEIIENIVNITSALGQLGSAFSSFAQIPKIFNNEDLTTGEKIFETISALTIATTMLASSISELTKIESVKLVLDKAKVLFTELYTAALGKMAAAQGIEVAAAGLGMKANAGLAASFGVVKTGAVKAGIAIKEFTVTLLTNPIGIAIVAITALVAGLGAAALAAKKANDELIKTSQAIIDQENAVQKEIDATNELRQNYLNMYDAYQKGNASKEDMAKITQDLTGYINAEAAAVAKLTGNYEDLTKEVLDAQKDKAEEALASAQREKNAAISNVGANAKKGKGYQSGDDYYLELDGWGNEKKAYDIVKKQLGDFVDMNSSSSDSLYSDLLVKTDFNDIESMVQLYDKLAEAKAKLSEEYGAKTANLGLYSDIDEWLGKMEESVTAYKNAVADVEKYSTQIEGFDIKVQEATDISSFREKRDALIDNLSKQFTDKTSDEIEAMADAWISQQGDAVNQLSDKLIAFNSLTADIDDEQAKAEIEELINGLNDEDLGIVLGHLQFSRAETAEELRNEIDFIKHSLKQEDITVSIKLAADAQETLLKGEALDAEAIKELQKSFDFAGIEFDWEAYDVANRGDQIEMLAQAMRDLSDATRVAYDTQGKYKKQNDNAIEENEKAIKIAEANVAGIAAAMDHGAGDLRRELAEAEAEVERLKAEGERLKATTFQTQFEAKVQQYSSDVKGIVSEVTALRNATDAIDGGFIVAAEDAQTLADLYPELYENSEVLADGRIQLDEEAVQAYLANRQKEYEKTKEVTQKELASEIAVLQAKMESNTATQEEINLLGQLMALYAELQGANFDFLETVGQVDTEAIEKLIDRYHDVNVSIKTLENSLNKLKQKQNGLVGNDLIKSLQKENELLTQINEQYETKKDSLVEEGKELADSLSKYGVIIENGRVTNYTEVWNKQKAQLDKDSNTSDEDARDAAIKYFETFEEELARYEEIVLEEIPELSETIAENLRTEVENNFKAWEIRFTEGLDLSEWEKSIDDFLEETQKDFTQVFTTDISKALSKNPLEDYLEDINNLINGEGGTINSLEKMNELFAELDIEAAGGESSMFGSFGEGLDKAQDALSQITNQAQNIYDEAEAAYDEYLDAIDQANDRLDHQYDRLQRVNNQLEFSAQWVELIYGPEAYDMMSKIYDSQIKNGLATVEHLKEEASLWQQRYEAEEEGSEAKSKYYDLWVEAEDELNNKIIEHIELLKNDYANTISQIIDNLEKDITNGFSLDEISEEWDRQKEHSDKYLDNVESLYEIQMLANKINASISDTSSVKNQQKLQKLYDKEITSLREMENLTKKDIEMAEKRYEIALKEMALEDAKNAKNSIKMVRDDAGNWSYQYVVDDDKVTSAQEDLSKTYNDLYQLTKDAYEDSVQSLLDLKAEYISGLEEIYLDETLTEEERGRKIQQLREYYEKELDILAEKHNLYRQALPNVTAGILYDLYKQDEDNYEAMTEAEKDLIKGLREAGVKDFQDLEDKAVANFEGIGDKAETAFSGVDELWQTDAANLVKIWTGDTDSVDKKIDKAVENMNKSVTAFKTELVNLENTSGKTFGYGEGTQYGLLQALKDADEDTEAVKKEMGLLDGATSNFYKTLNDNLEAYKEKMTTIKGAWEKVWKEIEKAIKKMQSYLALRSKAEEDLDLPTPQPGNDNSDDNGGNSGNGDSETNDGVDDVKTTPTSSMSPGQVWEQQNAMIRQRAAQAGLTPYSDLFYEYIDEDILDLLISRGDQKAKAAKDRRGQAAAVNNKSHQTQAYQDWLANNSVVNTPSVTSIPTTISSNTGTKTGGGGGGFGNVTILLDDSLFNPLRLFGFDTGGYTGDWNSTSGKLALLHEKELVLNQEDTKNILNVVSLVRGISDKIKSTAASALAGLAGGHVAYAGNSVVTEGATTFEIHAEFPNANNVNDIREAILSLPNYASQFNGRR